MVANTTNCKESSVIDHTTSTYTTREQRNVYPLYFCRILNMYNYFFNYSWNQGKLEVQN